MGERISINGSPKNSFEDKNKNRPRPKVVILHPKAKREISRELYYPTDRYRLSTPLFPEVGTISENVENPLNLG